MLIANALSDAVRFFHINALSSSLGFKIDFDMAIFRDLIERRHQRKQITVRFHRRAHLPIVLASGLIDKPVAVPWWIRRALANYMPCRGRSAGYPAPPRTDPYVHLYAYGLYGAFFVKGYHRYHPIFVFLVIPFFCSTRAASILPPRPHISIVVARSGGQGRRFFSAAEGSSLTAASTAAGCRRSGLAERGSEGSLPLAAINREPRLYSVEPHGVLTMKQSYASAGKAPRRRVHSLSGIAAIAGCGLPPPRIIIGYPAHQAQSGAEPVCPFSFWRVLLTEPAATRHRPESRRS
jgi:hypothetical protein